MIFYLEIKQELILFEPMWMQEDIGYLKDEEGNSYLSIIRDESFISTDYPFKKGEVLHYVGEL